MKTFNCIIHAPNIRTGGGFILLQRLLAECEGRSSIVAILDERVKRQLTIPEAVKVHWCGPNLISRLNAEWQLSRNANDGSAVLCFHNLPPFLPCKATVSVFMQNRLLISNESLKRFKWKTRARITFERCLSKAFSYRVARYIVQTPTMQRELLAWLGKSMSMQCVSVIPFLGNMPESFTSNVGSKAFDFVYIADGEAHKNHLNLVAAWQILAQEGIHPSLCLTLSERDTALVRVINEATAQSGLKITNAGYLSHQKIADLYGNSHALIFSSLTESFGLPLIEAAHFGLPILAPELDYVRDVCEPVQTFDPLSAVSIARAIKRHLRIPDKPLKVRSPSEFFFEAFLLK